MANGQSQPIRAILAVRSAGLCGPRPKLARLKCHLSSKKYSRHITVSFGTGESLEVQFIPTNWGDFYCVLTPSIIWPTCGSTAFMLVDTREVKHRLFWMSPTRSSPTPQTWRQCGS